MIILHKYDKQANIFWIANIFNNTFSGRLIGMDVIISGGTFIGTIVAVTKEKIKIATNLEFENDLLRITEIDIALSRMVLT